MITHLLKLQCGRVGGAKSRKFNNSFFEQTALLCFFPTFEVRNLYDRGDLFYSDQFSKMFPSKGLNLWNFVIPDGARLTLDFSF